MALMFVAALFFGDRVVTASAPRMTTQNTFDAKISAIKKPVYFQSFNHVMRTRRFEPARGRQQWRDYDLVKTHQTDERKNDYFLDAQNQR
jgi:hypothetical protein